MKGGAQMGGIIPLMSFLPFACARPSCVSVTWMLRYYQSGFARPITTNEPQSSELSNDLSTSVDSSRSGSNANRACSLQSSIYTV